MPNASMASIGEIYSLPESQTRDLQGCTDQEVISVLRERRSSLKYPTLAQSIARLKDLVSESWYVLSSPMEEDWMIDHGTWSPRKLVSIPNTFQGKSCNSPKFVGTKTTMDLKPTDGSKAVVGMTRYNLLTTREDGDGLDLDEDLALCHVFPLEGKGKGTRKRNITSEQFKDFAPPDLNGPEQVLSKLDFQNMHPLDTRDYHIDDLVPSKRPRSDHWDSFTKIHTKDPKLMYAACNHCDTMLKLKGGPSCGTGSLKNHNGSVRCKPKQREREAAALASQGGSDAQEQSDAAATKMSSTWTGIFSARESKKEERYKLLMEAQKKRMEWDRTRVKNKLAIEREKIELEKREAVIKRELKKARTFADMDFEKEKLQLARDAEDAKIMLADETGLDKHAKKWLTDKKKEINARRVTKEAARMQAEEAAKIQTGQHARMQVELAARIQEEQDAFLFSQQPHSE